VFNVSPRENPTRVAGYERSHLNRCSYGCAIADHWFISKIDAYVSLAAILKKTGPPRIGQEPDFTEHQAALHKLMKPHGHVIQPI